MEQHIPERFMTVRFESLTDYHKARVLREAKYFRSQNLKSVLEKLRDMDVIPQAPIGSNIFDPKKWSGRNWCWYLSIS